MQVDETSGFKTKTILCMPIHNSTAEIMGVVQLLNKMDNTPFNANDENLFEVNIVQQIENITKVFFKFE